MKYEFKTVANRENTATFKTDADMVKSMFDLPYYEDTISMWIADMDFACAPEITEAIIKRASTGVFGYSGATDEYYEALIKWHARRHQMTLKKEWLVHSHGTIAAIRNSIRALTKEGDGIIIQTPAYGPFGREIRNNNRMVLNNPLIRNEQNEYSIDFEDFESQCQKPNTKLFIFCNPHNPMGTVWTESEVARLMEITAKHDVLFLSDEIHMDLMRQDATFVSALNVPHNENCIVLTSLNKTFNVPALHATTVIIPNETLRTTFKSYTGLTPISPLTVAAAVVAYNECETWVDELKVVLDENMLEIKTFVEANLPKVKYNVSDGTYFAWLDFSAYGLSDQALVQKCAHEAHLIVESGEMFGSDKAGFIRMNTATPKTVIQEVLQRLDRVFNSKR